MGETLGGMRTVDKTGRMRRSPFPVPLAFLRSCFPLWIVLCLFGTACRVSTDCVSRDMTCEPMLAVLRTAAASAAPGPPRIAKFVLVSHTGGISVFRMDYAGTLSSVSGSPFAGGTGPHHMAVDSTGTFVYLANSASNNISAFRIDATSGVLTPISGSPFASGGNPYSTTVHPTGQFLFAGSESAATIYAYSINSSTGALSPVAGSPFAAGASTPGSVFVEPSGRFLYAGMTNASGQVGAYSIGADGSLTAVPGSPFPGGNDAISVNVHPNGQFVYTANYFSTNAYAYSMNSSTGALTQVGGTPTAASSAPGYIVTDPTGRFAYVSNSGNVTGLLAISAYTINATTGGLTPVSGSPFPAAANPLGLAVEPRGLFAFSANTGSNNVTIHSIDQTTGALTLRNTYAAGTSPFGVTFVPGF